MPGSQEASRLVTRACCRLRIISLRVTGPALVHVLAVALVPVTAGRQWTSSYQTYVFPDGGPVGFKPNTAVFRDPAAANAALRQLAQYLAANPAAKIEL